MSKHNPKRIAEKLNAVINAWQTLRATKTFASMTLDQFKQKVQPSQTARDQLTTLKTQATDSRVQRIQSDDSTLASLQLLVNAVKGDPDEGEDGPLYAAMGYVPKSLKRSGLTRKGQSTPVVQGAAANGAAATTAVK